jgi:hypothetical protein
MMTKQEALSADEERLITDMERVLREKMEKDYPAGKTRRDAHPKHTSLLRATFAVEANLPQELRVGVFAAPKSYTAWVRTSNASGRAKPDGEKDFRGFAIKLLDVPGDKIAESDETTTQDFVLLSHPTVPFGTAKAFRDAIYYSTKFGTLGFVAHQLLTGKAHVLKAAAKGRINPPSPLDIRYWSTVPYGFGEGPGARVVKYSVRPQDPSVPGTTMPTTLADDYLSQAAAARLARGPAVFDFMVQFQKGEGMPLDDAAVRWDETVSPFLKVATLTIPAQDFRTQERAEQAERLGFSPAHTLPAHRPLGGINRARMRIYKLLSQFRQQRNGVVRLTA